LEAQANNFPHLQEHIPRNMLIPKESM